MSRKSPLARAEMRKAIEPKAPLKTADDEGAVQGDSEPAYEAKRLKKMKRA